MQRDNVTLIFQSVLECLLSITLQSENYHVQIEGFTFLGENYHKIPRQAQEVVPSSPCEARNFHATLDFDP